MPPRPPAVWRHSDLQDHLPRRLYRINCISHAGTPVLANSVSAAAEWLAMHDPLLGTMGSDSAREFVHKWIQEAREGDMVWRWLS